MKVLISIIVTSIIAGAVYFLVTFPFLQLRLHPAAPYLMAVTPAIVFGYCFFLFAQKNDMTAPYQKPGWL